MYVPRAKPGQTASTLYNPNSMWKSYVICVRVYQGALILGYSVGWTAPVVPKLQNLAESPLPEKPTEGQASWIASLIYVGSIIGPYSLGLLANVKGRKPCLIISALIITASYAVLGAAQNLWMIYASRMILGLGLGIIGLLNVVYIGEIASINIRGMLLSGNSIFCNLGTLIIYCIGPYVSYVITAVIGVGLSLLYLLGLCFIPETPLFYVMKGKEYEAQNILVQLGRSNEIEEVLKSIIEENKSLLTDWKELLTIKGNRVALFILLTLCILQQTSGMVAVIFFATTIFEVAGSTVEPNLATIIIGITQLVASCIVLFFIERSGRKVLMLFSTVTCSLSLATLGLYFYWLDVTNNPLTKQLGWLPLLALVIFFFSYNLGFGIVPHALRGEMFEPNARSLGSAVTSTIAWAVGFGVSAAFGYMVTAWGSHVTFWVYSGACLSAFVFTAVFVPETRGKSLLEIQIMLNDGRERITGR